MGSLNKNMDRLINDLKNLPRIQTPDNFEFNLQMKIQNGSFDLNDGLSKRSFLWVTVPAFSFVFSAVILFFVIDINPAEHEDLLMSQPEPIVFGVDYESNAMSDDESAIESQLNLSTNSPGFRMVLKQNDVVVKERINYPFDQTQSVDLDRHFGAADEENLINSSPIRTVGIGSENTGFGGFLVRVPMTLEERKALKAKLDSIKQIRGELLP